MKIWTPKWPDGCRQCRTKKRTHMGQGYCTRCYRRQRTKGALGTVRREARIRRRDGATQYFCFDCETWKSEPEFRKSKKWFRTRCHACHLRIRTEQRDAARDELNAKRRAWNAERTRRMREADRVRKKSRRDPWGMGNHGKAMIPMESVLSWLTMAMEMADEETGPLEHASRISGVSTRRLYEVRTMKSGDKVGIDTAERIARAVDKMDEFRELTKPGIQGWSRHSDFCLRCGRYDVPHHALGYCPRCYQVVWWHRRKGRSQPPHVRGERWTMWHLACVICKKKDYPHHGHGVCSSCYHKEKKKR